MEGDVDRPLDLEFLIETDSSLTCVMSVAISVLSSCRSVDEDVMFEMVGSVGMVSMNSSARRATSAMGSLSFTVNMFLWMEGGRRW